MKTFTKLMLLFFLFLIAIGVWMQIQAKEKGKKHFEEFNLADINTQIQSVRIAYKGTEMKLIDRRDFVFYPITDEYLNDGNIFSYTAAKGDYVQKSAFSDTLFLIKEDKKFAYLFVKFNE
ncbi:hypothetical protein [Algoriphagus aquimarinus]|uniref:hypothetical protein n=1 Tax=Algoriphagus aquimarinus TaxID=237018 RepID=UPI0030D95778|tara:strand:- start:42950 stop:43309 length:360 start_codon:yes stop_codon:yes gene_type:complete